MDYIYGKLSNVTNINEFIERIEECEVKVDECEQQVDYMTNRFDEAMTQFGELETEVGTYSGRIAHAEEVSNSASATATEAMEIAQNYQDLIDSLETRKEDKENKVKSTDGWSQELSDIKYPSEKLVKETIDDETTARTTAINNLNGTVGTLTTDLTNEITRATGVEGGLRTDLNNEITTRGSEITRVEGLVTTEETRAKGVEESISGHLSELSSTVESNYNTLDGKIDSEVASLEESKQDVIDSSNKLSTDYISGLSNVATSGAYSDLSGTPTKVSDFTNDAGYVTNSQVDVDHIVYSVNNTEAVNGNVTIDIPTKTSDLLNDSQYVTGSIQNNTITIGSNSVEYGETGVGKLVQLDNNGKLNLTVIPSTILGQMIYGGTFDASTDTATLSDNAKILLGVTSDTIILKNDTTEPGGYVINEGIYYVTSVAGTFVDSAFNPKDWLVSTGSGWCKIDNTNDDIVASYRGRRGDVVPYIEDIVDGTTRKLSTTVTPLEELKAQVRTNIGAGTSNFSGDYTDLTNKPDLSIYETKAEAFSGDYDDLTNKPNLNNFVEKSQTSGLLKNDGTVDTTQYGTSNFSGDYNDLTNKPTIPVVPQNITQSVSVNGSTYTPDANGNVDLGNIGGGGGGSYTAGTGIDITNNVISVDSSLLANCIGYEEVVE